MKCISENNKLIKNNKAKNAIKPPIKARKKAVQNLKGSQADAIHQKFMQGILKLKGYSSNMFFQTMLQASAQYE